MRQMSVAASVLMTSMVASAAALPMTGRARNAGVLVSCGMRKPAPRVTTADADRLIAERSNGSGWSTAINVPRTAGVTKSME